MSCFVVEKECIDRAVFLFSDNCIAPGIRELDHKELSSLGSRFLQMNERAYSLRYNVPVSRLPSDYQYLLKNQSLIQSLKSAQCLLYQCSERGIPENWPEYHQLEERILQVLKFIVSQLPEYQESKWG